jgi:signal transduction histidine kinase
LLVCCIVLAVGVVATIALFSTPYTGIEFDYDPQGGRITSIDPSGPAGGHPGALLMVFLLARSLMTLPTPEELAQTKWVLMGILFPVLVGLFFFTLPLFGWHMLYSHQNLALALIFVPLSMTFAMTRYGLMEIDTLIDNTVIYTLTLGGLIVLDLGAIAILSRLKGFGMPLGGVGSSVLSVWITLVAYLPIRTRVTHWVKRRFKRQPYNPHQVALDLSADFLLETDLTALLQKTMRVIAASLHPVGMTAFLYQGNRRIDETGMPPGRLLSPEDFHPQIERSRRLKQGEAMDGGGMLVPLNGTSNRLGFFLLNEKYSRNLYTREDRSLLEIIANQTALAIERLYAVETVARKEVAVRAAQDRISRDIHDSIGGAISNALILVDMMERNRNEQHPERRRPLRALRGVLSEGLSDLRNLLWMLEGTTATVGSLMTHLREKFGPMADEDRIGIAMTLTLRAENDQLPLPPTAGLNLFRILQESVTNAMKHAEATRIEISVVESGRWLSAKICDNGKGFDRTTGSDHRYGLRNLKKRAEEIGAELEIVSEVGVGTTITLSLIL